MSPQIRAETLIQLMQDIIAILEEENTLLDEPRSEKLKHLVDQKMALFQSYESQLQQLSQMGGFAKGLDTAQKKQLQDLSVSFAKISKINETKLAAMVKSSGQIMDVIKKEAQRKTQTVNAYSAHGAGYTSSRSRAAAVAINQQL